MTASIDLSLPPQVSPPEFALSSLPPAGINGVSALAYGVQPGGPDGAPLVPAEADELVTAAGLDLLAVLESRGATGAVGDVVAVPLSHQGAQLTMFLVGVGEQRPADLRRAGAALARAAHRTHGRDQAGRGRAACHHHL